MSQIEKEDFGLCPLKVKALDSALGPKRRKGVPAETTDNQVIYNVPLVFYESFTLHSHAPCNLGSSLLAFRDNTGVE
jgi:hypothetical protein